MPRIARALAARIRARVTRPWVLMEICGGQTHTIMRYGLPELLPPEIELVHGPGCPVCVAPLEISGPRHRNRRPPRRHLRFLRRHAARARLALRPVPRAAPPAATCASPIRPWKPSRLARENPARQVVFFGIGFETTAPANAMAVWQAKREGLANFSMLVSHVLVPPAMRLILSSPANRVQGFIAPGHVCTRGGLPANTKSSAPNSACPSWWAVSSRWICWKPSPCWWSNWKRAARSWKTSIRAPSRAPAAPPRTS